MASGVVAAPTQWPAVVNTGDFVAVGVEEEGVVAVALQHGAADGGQLWDVEDVDGVDAQEWGECRGCRFR